MNCSYCQNQIFKDDRFCPSCGGPNKSFIDVLEKPTRFSNKVELWRAYQELPNVEHSFLINPMTYIKVCSLLNYTLVLSTEGFGKGNVYRFNSFGNSLPIRFDDLQKICINQEAFSKYPYFCIFNKNIVDALGLTYYYNKEIEEVLNAQQ